MSKISTIYDAVLSKISTVLSTKTKLPNAYDVDNNPVHLIKNGWGLRISPASVENRTVCHVSQVRTFTVLLTSQVYRLDTNTSALDDTSKALLEDVKLLIDGMESSDQIGTGATVIDKITFTSCSGIELLGTKKSHFIIIEVDFDISYSEDRT